MINRLGKTSNIIGIVAMDELVINGFVGNLAKAVDGESIAIACDVTCGVDVRVVTEKEVLLGPPPKTFDVPGSLGAGGLREGALEAVMAANGVLSKLGLCLAVGSGER